MYDIPGHLRGVDNGVRDAVRFALGVVVVGAVFLLTAVMWVSTCQGATADTVACGVPQRTLLALAAPAALLLGGLWALVRTYQGWREGRASRAWQGAGWFLLTTMLLVLMTSLPPLTGSTVIG